MKLSLSVMTRDGTLRRKGTAEPKDWELRTSIKEI
jgi:hypothetical protein